MANPTRAYAENVPGDFFVDETCIDCDLCRQIAPSVFRDAGDYSVVYHQPGEDIESRRAEMALVACPTGSIGTQSKRNLKRAIDAFPERVEENVYFCGYASPNSYGAASYLIQRPNGNVLVDSPRFAKHLVKRLDDMGGIATMFLTHRDDVADHEKYRDRFGCRRIIHKADSRGIDTEQVLEGESPIQLDDELLAIPVPGHTRGHVVLLYRDKFLFTGDHLAWSENRDGLTAFRSVAWYSWREQTQSMKKLLGLRFEWVLPGHGRRVHLPANEMQQSLVNCIEWMEKVA
jgi:glyoxylase-like metal-dependent hydrolase (beta-lactamase superfamily II)/ferredoxin